MNSRKTKLVAGWSLLALCLLSHVVACTWTSKNRLAGAPLVTIRNGVVIDEAYAAKWRIAQEQFERVQSDIKQLMGADPIATEKQMATDARAFSKYKALLAELNLWLNKMEEASPYAFGEFGIYPRGGRDVGIILGMVVPVILFVSAAFMFVLASVGKGHVKMKVE